MNPNMPSSGRVDVLAALDCAAEQVRGGHVCASYAERCRVDDGIRAARRAVAKLIEREDAMRFALEVLVAAKVSETLHMDAHWEPARSALAALAALTEPQS